MIATGHRTRVRLRLAAAALLAVTAGLALPSGAAQAHAFLTASNPGDGQVLPAPPRQLTLEFSEHVELASTRIELSRGGEAPVALTGLRLVTGGEGDSAAAADGTEESRLRPRCRHWSAAPTASPGRPCPATTCTARAGTWSSASRRR